MFEDAEKTKEIVNHSIQLPCNHITNNTLHRYVNLWHHRQLAIVSKRLTN